MMQGREESNMAELRLAGQPRRQEGTEWAVQAGTCVLGRV